MMLPPISQQQHVNHQPLLLLVLQNHSLQNHSKNLAMNLGIADSPAMQDIKQQLRIEITNDLLNRIISQSLPCDYNVEANNRSDPVLCPQDSFLTPRSNTGANEFRSITTIIYEILSLLEIIICDGKGANNPDLLNMCVNIKRRLALQCSNANSLLSIDKIYAEQQAPRKRKRSQEKLGFRVGQCRNIDELNLIQVQADDEVNQQSQQESNVEEKNEFAHNSMNKLRKIDKLISNYNDLSNCRTSKSETLFVKDVDETNNNNTQNLGQELSFANDQFILNINGLNHNVSNLEKLWTDPNRNNTNILNEHSRNQFNQFKNQTQFASSSNIQNENQTSNMNSLRVENLISKETLVLANSESGSANINETTSSSHTNSHSTAIVTANSDPDSTSTAGGLNNNVEKVSINNILNEGSSLYLPVENIKDHIITNRNSNVYHTQHQAGKLVLKKKDFNEAKLSNDYNSNGDAKISTLTTNNNASMSAAMMIPSIGSLIETAPENHSHNNNIIENNPNEIFTLATTTAAANENSVNLLNPCIVGMNINSKNSILNNIAFPNNPINNKSSHRNNSKLRTGTPGISGGSINVNSGHTNKYISINELLKDGGKRDIEEDNEDREILMQSDADRNININRRSSYVTEYSNNEDTNTKTTAYSENDISDNVFSARRILFGQMPGNNPLNNRNSKKNRNVLSNILQTTQVPNTEVTGFLPLAAELKFLESTSRETHGTVGPEKNTRKQVGFSPMYDFIKTDSLKTILIEYFYGIGENMSIRQMEREFGTRWRGGSKHSMSKTFNRRKNLYKIAEILLSRSNFQIQDVIERLESVRKFLSVYGELTEKKSLAWLCNNISLEMIDESKYFD